MKINYLGTAAFEGVPALFCSCDVCEEARKLGGKNYRTRSQALINEDLLIDFNADTYTHFHYSKFDLRKVDSCLITHSHCDHFYVDDIEMARRDFIWQYNKTLHFYGGSTACRQISDFALRPWNQGVFDARVVYDGEVFTAGNYEVLALRANHDPASSPLIYAISDGKKRMLYGNDTHLLFDSNYEHLKKFGHLDLVSLDCTGMIQHGWTSSHMTLELVLEVFDRMKKEGIIDDTTIKVVNHFSHNGGINHDAFSEICKQYGIIVAYDGLEIEF